MRTSLFLPFHWRLKHMPTPWSLSKTGKIGVIGAGIAGLATANRLLRAGYKNITIFDKKAAIGGVWALPYPGLSVQNPMFCYYFPEYKYEEYEPDESITTSISGYRMNKYINNYVKHNKMEDIIQLNTAINLLEFDKNSNKWSVNMTKNYDFVNDYASTSTTDNINSETVEEEFDFVVVCSGLNHVPKLRKNEIINYDKFNGKMYYSFELNQEIIDEVIENNHNVLVIGGGKTSREIASTFAENYEANNMNNIVHNVDPATKWNVPIPYTVFGKDLGGPPLLAPWMSLLSEKEYLKLSFKDKIIYNIGYWKRWYHYKLLNISAKQNTPKDTWYYKSFEKMKCSLLIIEPLNSFNGRVAKKQIKVHKTRFQGFDEKGHIKLANNEYLNKSNIDVIILGVGWNLSFPFLKNKNNDLDKIIEYGDKDDANKDQQYSDNLLLYRYCINPYLPRIAFNGCCMGFDHFVPNYFVACYILNLMQNKINIGNLPGNEEMINEIKQDIKWRKENDLDGNYFLDPLRVSFLKSVVNDLDLNNKTINWFGPNDSFIKNYLGCPENFMYHIVPFEQNND